MAKGLNSRKNVKKPKKDAVKKGEKKQTGGIL